MKTKKCAAALGTFDGVHLGHKKVICEAVFFARSNREPCVVATFDPHPYHITDPKRNIKLLSTIEERAALVCGLGADRMAVLKFDKKLRSMSPRTFAEEVIVKRLKAACVFVGEDYTFGKDKKGHISVLKKLGRELGFGVKAVKDKFEKKRIVKSTLIRRLLECGEFSHAVNLMGHPYPVFGRVVAGEGRGRTLGFPTANVRISADKLLPMDGVYSCTVRCGKKTYKGALNIGKRPTFSGKTRTVEVYLIGFSGDLAGKDIKIFINKRLRKEKRFHDGGELASAIRHDVKKAMKISGARS